jgi:short-subunit dehydrogenase
MSGPASDFKDRYGSWAVIAGGSDGIGASFAHQVAAEGINVVLLARRRVVLDECAASVRRSHSVEVRTVSVDLTAADFVAGVRSATDDLEVGLLIYNAGAPQSAPRFLDEPIEQALALLRLNCDGPLLLAHHFGQSMRQRRRGGMIFLTSVAGLAGSSYQATYCATKAFDHLLAESLWHDLHGFGIDVLSLVVGATHTPTAARTNLDFGALGGFNGQGATMTPDAVAAEGLSNLGKGPFWIAGEVNRQAAGLFLSPDRVRAIETMSMGAAVMRGLEYRPVTSRE